MRHRSRAAVALGSLMSERQLLAAVRELANLAGGRIYHTHDSRRSERGFIDVVLLVSPRAWFLELKSETGVVTAEQKEWLEALRACGFDARVVRPSDLEDLAAEVLSR
jgi:hypothetical protein